MKNLKDELLGVSLSGRYRLEEWLGDDKEAAFFLTSAKDGARAVLKLIPDNPSTAAGQLVVWQKTASLSHPNLLPLLDCGRGDAAGCSFVYAVFEFPDESLASALGQRPLSEEESREVWNSVVDALRYIHSNGLVHGAVNPDHIVAVGDRIKLDTDALREPAPGLQPADDFRALGKMGLQGAPAAPPLVAPATPSIPPPARRPAPAVAPPRGRSIPIWIYPAVAVLLVFAVLVFRRNPKSEPAAPVPSAVAATTASPAPPRAPIRPAVAPPRPRSAWRVVAYTYSTFRGAEKKARTINDRLPGMRAEVFTPKGKNRPPYMVALGGQMTREEAARLQKQAKSKGLPRDTFIRNYSE